ncbi:diguanylate cyclase [Rheinheimera riviphila]|uniref:diguanylate cyclase n=2 Tax=Rheinheimera riviphila TaxID=1834037 RepID=A0A437QR69_9GAMM|nr:diguanylate cyclase [Rheinheimera riviphila]
MGECAMLNRFSLMLSMLAAIVLLSTVSQAQQPDALLFTAEEIAYLKQKQQLRYCIDPNWLPFEALDAQQKHIGMSADYLKLLGQLLPLTMQLVPTKDWSESLLFLQQQRCDFLPLAMRTPSREKFLLFTKPYLTIPSVIATTIDKPYLEDLHQVAKMPIGIRRGFGFIELYQAQYPDLQIIPYDSYEEGLLQVQSGLLYGFLGNMGSISFSLQQNKMTNLKISGRLTGDSEMSIGSRIDEPLLSSVLQKALLRIDANAQQQINNQWLKVQFEHKVDYRLWWLLVSVVLVLSLLGSWFYLKTSSLNRALRLANAELEQLSQHDPLTGLYNRQYLDTKLQQALALCQRQQLPLTLAMMDLDHFKQVNDECGHLFGDQCLRHFAALCLQNFQRPQDMLVRYGGEEFILISVGTPAADMKKLLQAFVGKFAADAVEWAGQQRFCTISIGAYCQVPPLSLDAKQLLQLADEALYVAKNQGRDQLHLVEPTAAE